MDELMPVVSAFENNRDRVLAGRLLAGTAQYLVSHNLNM